MLPSVINHAEKVYLDYTQTELDQAYAQAEWASNMNGILASWARRGAACRGPRAGYREAPYGPAPCEKVDVFEVEGPVVHLHIHGGAWQRQSKEDCSFIASAMRARGVPFVVPEFGKLPEYRMPQVLDQIARATLWTYETFVASSRAEGLVISGHSSGAHMAALLASYDFGDALPVSALRAIFCISGSYDLEPVLLSARRQYIDLDDAECQRLSPIQRVAQMRLPIHLLFGTEESPEFIRQSVSYAAVLASGGRLASCEAITGANHFEMADQLGRLESPVGQRLEALLGMPHKASDAPAAQAGNDGVSKINNENDQRRRRR